MSAPERKTKTEAIALIIGFAGAMGGLLCTNAFYGSLLMSLPLWARMIGMIVGFWLIALVPLIVSACIKEKPADFGFTRKNLAMQLVWGLVIAAAMSLVLTVIPTLAGFGEYVDSGKKYFYTWQFVYEFVFCMIAVGFTEEIVFRGFIYNRLKNLSGSDIVAVIVSSALFGFYHILSGDILQIFVTAVIGALLCLCRLKIKNCTILSLMIGHGIYDFLITFWATKI